MGLHRRDQLKPDVLWRPMEIAVYWVLDKESDTIVGSTHTSKSAKTMASEHARSTHRRCRIRRVMMDEAYTHHDDRRSD
jgi:hypothetical protein